MYQAEVMWLEDYIRELTSSHQRREHYATRVGAEWRGLVHVTTVPGLLAQLRAGDVPSGAVESGQRAVYESKPVARLDAIDTAARIDLEAARWVRELGEDDPLDTVECLRLLGSLAASADAVTRRAIEADARRWWTRARVVTGWDAPAWRPNATCPACGHRGSVSIRLADQLAACGADECGAAWDASTIGILADHMRAEGEDRG